MPPIHSNRIRIIGADTPHIPFAESFCSFGAVVRFIELRVELRFELHHLAHHALGLRLLRLELRLLRGERILGGSRFGLRCGSRFGLRCGSWLRFRRGYCRGRGFGSRRGLRRFLNGRSGLLRRLLTGKLSFELEHFTHHLFGLRLLRGKLRLLGVELSVLFLLVNAEQADALNALNDYQNNERYEYADYVTDRRLLETQERAELRNLAGVFAEDEVGRNDGFVVGVGVDTVGDEAEAASAVVVILLILWVTTSPKLSPF